MTTAHQGFIINKLLEKGGVLNKVAANYVKAGFNVRVKPGINDVDLIAIKRNEYYCIKVLWKKKIFNEQELSSFIENCDKIKCRPVIILYGSGPKIDPGFLGKYKVKIRRIRLNG